MLANKVMGATSAAPDINYIEDAFSTYLYTGNGSAQAINNGIDLAGEGGLVWIKDRTNAYNNCLFDTTQGATKVIWTNRNTPTQTNAVSLTAFNSDGFSLGTGNTSSPIGIQVNTNGDSFVSWAFREAPKFFDVVTYTGTGTGVAQNIAHSLGSAPGCIIAKNITNNGNWHVYHRSLGNGNVAYLNLTNPPDTVNYWDNTTPTSTQFSVKAENNLVGDNYVAYLFAHNAGGFGLSGNENVVSCGSFTTDGSGNATVNLGYEPQWVMVKAFGGVNSGSGGAGDWFMQDVMRNMSVSGTGSWFYANTNNAEMSSSSVLRPTSTGFVSAQGNLTTNTDYIYIAIRRGPMKVPTLGTKVFQPDTNTANPATYQYNPGFSTDWAIFSYRGSSAYWYTGSRLQGAPRLLFFNDTAIEEGTVKSWYFDNPTGTFKQTVGGDGVNSILVYMFGRAPGFMDVVCYTGTGAVQNISHNLGVVPELIIAKGRTVTNNWPVYNSASGATSFTYLNSSQAAFSSSAFWNNTAPTSSVFTVGINNPINTAASSNVAYLFATCPGVSKVGSYTGTGTTQAINCGFTAGARFVLIKRTDLTGDWYVWDSARGIVAGNDPYMLINIAAAEVTGTDYIDPVSSGFEISSTAPAAINANGGSYIFLAVA